VAGLGFVSAAVLAACGNKGGDTAAPVAEAPSTEPFTKLVEADGNFAYNALEDGVEYHCSNVLSPAYYVFAGVKDADGGRAGWPACPLRRASRPTWVRFVVVNPVDRRSVRRCDVDALRALAAAVVPQIRVKVLGVDEGADSAWAARFQALLCRGCHDLWRSAQADAAGVPFVPAYS
jgi:hypothetical protein